MDSSTVKQKFQSTSFNMEEEKSQESIDKARIIRNHQDRHEAEVSCGGEADLRKHCTGCQKNPGHRHFIPVHDFKMEHLPLSHQDNIIMDYIRTEADLTCRLSVRYTSGRRPKYYPGREPITLYPFHQDRGGDWLRTGTGCVCGVYKYAEKDGKDCECGECRGSCTPKKVWGKVKIRTVCHVVYDSLEARHTTCHFGYNTSTADVSDCPTLTGLEVEDSDAERDCCMMTCASHDMKLVNELSRVYTHSVDLWEIVRDKYRFNKKTCVSDTGTHVSCVTNPTPGPVVIISHPHGLSKHITLGEWTRRKIWGETERYEDDNGWEIAVVKTSYSYNTPTCPGSSGAPVIKLPGKWWWWWSSHPHSEGGEGNDNKSGVMGEIVLPPTTTLSK